jgi:hypothetical protein
MRKVGKDLWTILDELCGPRDFQCWPGGLPEAASATDEGQINHCREHHRTRIAKVNGYWWILD